MIKSFRHKGIKQFFEKGTTKGIQAGHKQKLQLQLQLTALNMAKGPQDMAVPAWQLHPLQGQSAGQWSISVNGNWRLTFAFDGEDAVLVDYQDCH